MLRTELIRPLHELVAGHASERGDTVAFADRVRSVTYAELHVRTGRLAGHLAALRLHPGDRAVILQGNAVEVVESYLAVLRASGVAVPCNPAGSADELAHVLDDSGARVVLTDPAHLEQVLGLLPGRSSVTVLVTGDGPLPRGVHGYERLARTEPPQPARDDQDLDDVAFMLYTSGTTGSPKGVLSTQRSCLWSVAACYAPIVGLAAGDRVLWPLPLHHSLAHVLCVVGVTAVGATARLMAAFDPHDVLAELRAGSYTFLAGVPAMYHRLVAEARAAGGVPNGLTRALTAGSICPGPLRTAFEQTFGAPLLDGYGSTETCGLMAVNWPTGATVDGSCGLPVPGIALRLVGDDGRDVDAGAEGEVWVRGPNLMVGYHGRPDATAEAMPGGWYRTGDLGRFDEAGYLTITGRTRELIIRSGENVHPAEIEDVLLGVPGVADAAVTGRPHEVQGEVPVAFVVAGPGGVDPDAALAACRERLAAFKVPEELFEIDRVPRTSSGKITRHLLLDGPARLRATAGGRHRTVLRTSWTPLPSTRTGVRELPRRWSAAGGAPADLHGIAGVLDALGVDRDAEDPEITVLAAVVPPAGGRGVPDAASVATATRDADARCRALLAGPGRVVAVTVGAVDPGGDPGAPDPAAAAVWGGLAALQAEHPDRLVLLDTDGTPASADALALAVGTDEPRLALREGVALVPRLAPAGPPDAGTAAPDPDPRGAVAVAGAPGPRTAALVRHLVRGHRLGQVLLCGPDGLGDPAIARLAGELDDLGAACAVHDTDPADPDALAAALASAPRPVTVLVHADGERGADLDAVLAGALHCDRASRSAARAPALVLTGTVRGALGSAGCGAESAAAAFLSALAAARVRDGLGGCVLAWGDPEPEVPPAAGVGAVAVEEVAAAADVALPARADAVVVRLEATETGTPGPVPVLLRGLLETVAAAGPSDPVRDALRARVEPLDEAGRTAAFTAIVRTALAETLGVDVPASRDGRAFREAGLNSVGAVQLRNRLAAATGLELSAAVAFDHPTPAALAAFLRAGVLGETAPSRRALPARPPSDDDPVVLVGTACRYPGGIASPEDLWRVLDAGGHVMGPFPDDRGWDLAALAGGASATREGGFLSGAADFDAAFFGISPREALASDPQQRLLLESAWELFERAGIAPDSLHGTRTGVFAGVMYHDYGSGHAGPPQGTEAHWGVGTAGSVVSGRIAYQLGLEGPAITVDTACSSSLVALHLAAQSLRAGECDLAVAGGVTVMATPGSFVEFTRQGGLAPDGRCKPFAEAADGTAWSEGVGLLLLERQSDALRNGHEVLAVLRGSAVNSDGASNGLTAPNGPSQQRVIDAALAAAGLGPDDVDVVQAHGTGTTLGDPIEAEALRVAYGDRSEELLLGSVKANLGHTQAAAGAAGVIAMVQAMRHGVVPATPGVDAPSSAVDWAAGPVRLVTAAEKWPDRDRPRRAAVSAFGISGTNAHVVLEQAPGSGTGAAREPAGTEAWFVSAATPEALDAHVGRITAVAGGLPRGDVAHALVHGRSRFEHRAVLLATDSGVREVARGRAVPRRVAVLFSGQGTQRPGMGRDLYGRFPAFAEAFDEVLGHLRPGLREIVWGDDAERLARTGTAQPALFAFHVAAAALLRSWGVTPALAGGHSIGALAAAHLAGVLDLASAARLVTARGELMEALPGGGAMVAVEAGEDEIAAHLGPEVALAAVNGPSAVVLSGAADAVDAVAASFSARGRRTGRFPVSHAFHSHLMEPISVPLREVLDGLDLTPARIPVLSDVTGTVVDPAAPADPDYWVRHARGTVRFAGLVAAAARAGVDTVVELGPDATLSGLVPDALPVHGDVLVTPLCRDGRSEVDTALTAAARLHVAGAAVRPAALVPGSGAPVPELPTYPFDRRRFWPEPPAGGAGGVPEVPALCEEWVPLQNPPSVPERVLVVVDGGRPAAALTGVGASVGFLDATGLDRAALAAALADAATDPPDVVLSLPVGDTADTAGGEVPASLLRRVTLAGALVDAGVPAPLWCATTGAVPVGSGEAAGEDTADTAVVNPEQCAVWGWGRSAALEDRLSWGGLVDLPAEPGPATVAALASVLTGASGEDQVAIRDGAAFGRRLVPAPTGDRAAPVFRDTVLVTGGTGGLGAHVARHVVRRGAAHVVLAGRRGEAAPGVAALVAELSEAGARVTVAACDCADAAALRAVVEAVPADLPLRAVVHAAGVDTGDAAAADLTTGGLAELFGPKVGGARALREVTADAPLEMVVLFSSAAATWGGAGQAGYAAANAQLDGMAQAWRDTGVPVVSLAWGPWAGQGLAGRDGVADRMRRQGLLPLDPRAAMAALDAALSGEQAVRTVVDVDWERFAPGFTAVRPSPLLAGVPDAARALAPPEPTGPGPAALPAVQRPAAVLDLVRREVAAVLGHPGPADVDPDRSFRDQGFDSMAAVELRDRLRVRTGLPLATALVFDHPTPKAVTAHLVAALAPASEPDPSPAAAVDRLESALAAGLPDPAERAPLERRLAAVLDRLRAGDRAPGRDGAPVTGGPDDDIRTADVDDLLDIIDAQL